LAKTIEQLGGLSGKIHPILRIVLIVTALAAPATGFLYSGRYGLFLGVTIMLGLLGWAMLFSVISGTPHKKMKPK